MKVSELIEQLECFGLDDEVECVTVNQRFTIDCLRAFCGEGTVDIELEEK